MRAKAVFKRTHGLQLKEDRSNGLPRKFFIFDSGALQHLFRLSAKYGRTPMSSARLLNQRRKIAKQIFAFILHLSLRQMAPLKIHLLRVQGDSLPFWLESHCCGLVFFSRRLIGFPFSAISNCFDLGVN